MRLLDGFTVEVDDTVVPAESWTRRSAASLVKLLALSPRRRLHRDRAIATLWPDVDPASGSRRLHQAAHYARRALRCGDAVVLRDDVVALFPQASVVVDAVAFANAAEAALASASLPECLAVLDGAGDLLPEDLGEQWLDESREQLRRLRLDLLRSAGRWEEILRSEPADEQAHLALLREAVASGHRGTVLRRYAEMEKALAEHLGIGPGPEAVALRDEAGTVPTRAPATSYDDQPADQPTGPPPLLERQRHLELLDAAARRAAAERRGTVVLVPGEAGAGKTALIRAFVQQLPVPLVALVGGCEDLIAPRALGPFRDMAEASPDLESFVAGGDTQESLPRFMRFLADKPAVVVVEDVHWADDATLDVLRYVARRVSTLPTVLVLTYRIEGLPAEHPLHRVLGALAGAPVTRLHLPPLSVEAMMHLGAASPREAAEVHQVTQGNPFFATEVLASGGAGVPPTVRDAVLARMGLLPEPVRALLGKLSVVPAQVERWLAETLAGDVETLLVAERSGMLAGDAGAVRFRHELARQAVESSLTAGERVRANATVVQALLGSSPPDAARLVHHAERAGMVDVLLEHGPDAAEEAAGHGSHRQAAEILRVVLHQARGLSRPDRALLHTRRAYSLYVVNHFEAAFGEARRATETAMESQDPLLLGDALLILTRAAYFARGPLLAREAATEAIRVLRDVGDEGRYASALTALARSHSNLAMVGIVAEPCAASEAAAVEAVEIGTRLDRPDILSVALCYLGDAQVSTGRLEGLADLARAVEVSGSDSRVETQVRCLVNAAGGAYRVGRFSLAERYVEQGVRLVDDGEFFAGAYRLRLTRAAVRASAGAWDESISELSELTEVGGEPGIMAPLARSMLARLLARRGDARAQKTLRVAAEAWVGCVDPYIAGPLAVAAVELGWLDGSMGDLTAETGRVLALLAETGPRALHAELVVYLRRLGLDVHAPDAAPGPWAATLAGDWRSAAEHWGRLGERYERALVLAGADDAQARRLGHAELEALGATAVVPAL